jgi:SsrA-binding protein
MGNIVTNKKANFEYTILEEFIAGVILFGNEVKSIRNGDVAVTTDSFVYIKDGKVWAKNIKVARYKKTHFAEKHDENRDKNLLLKKKEISKIKKLLQNNGTSIITLSIFTLNNRIKFKIAVVKGKKLYDKREIIKKRDIERDISRFQ